MKIFSILLFFCLGTTFLFSQENADPKKLLKKANENFELLGANPKKAFANAKEIEKEAQRTDAQEAELRAINTKCRYYRLNNDFENMMTEAKSLFQKAELNKSLIYQAVAKKYLFESYAYSGLPDKGFQELEEGIALINESDNEDSLNIIAKADLYLSFSNYYSLFKNDYKSQLDYTRLSGKEYAKLPEGKNKHKLLYLYYSNLASVYNDINKTDSAKFYATLSQSKDKGYERNDIKFLNLSVLGNVSSKEKNYEQALSYFKEAEKLKGYKNHQNIENLYNNIMKCYNALKQEDSIQIYQAKKDSLKLTISQSQNKSLHNLLNEKEKDASQWYFFALAILFLLILILVFSIRKKNRILVQQEKISQQYLSRFSQNRAEPDYSKLIEMFKNNDTAFISCFTEYFPDFYRKILDVNPKIVQSEIEFCALLKLKIPGKEIAKYKFIEPKTVRNKKYLIRQKLDIPKDIDIYQFFDEL